MKVELEILDVGAQTFLEGYLKCLPSLSPETRAKAMKQMGQEPWCKENLNYGIFILGLEDFMKKVEQGATPHAVRGILKAETAKVITDTMSKMVNLHIIHEAKLKGIEKRDGKDSALHREQSCFLSGIDRVIAEVDADLTGSDELQKALSALDGEVPISPPTAPQAPAPPPKPKPGKTKSRRKKK